MSESLLDYDTRQALAAFGTKCSNFSELPTAFFILAKAQLLRESKYAFFELHSKSCNKDFINHLQSTERGRIMAIESWELLQDYIEQAKRMSLVEWLASLTFEHTQD
jgi:hypothetical protein